MYQRFSKPDLYCARTGRLDAFVHERAISGAPAFMRGVRVLFASDTHVLPRTSDAEIDALVARMAALAPDIALLGGDYSDTAEGAVRLFDALKGLRPPLGMFGVIGNNDAEAWDSARELRRAMAKAGVRLLVNQSERLRVNGGTLYVGGVDEHRYGAPHYDGLYPVAPSPDAYRVLLSHYPCRPARAPDLMLSGHTHGGQFNALGLTPFFVGFERLSRRPRSMAIAGLCDIGDMKLLVSKGIGASRLQLRVGVRPEVELLTFA